jgi:hypothetical protein
MFANLTKISADLNFNKSEFRTNFTNIRLSEQFFMRFNPQIYYLKMDKDDGFYFLIKVKMY